MPIFILHALVAALILLVGIRVLRKRRRGLASNFLLGWAFQVLLSVPAGLYQAINSWPHIAFGADSFVWWRMIWVPLVGWPFNAAGLTVSRIFEGTVEPLEWLVGHPLFLVPVGHAGQSDCAPFLAAIYEEEETFRSLYCLSGSPLSDKFYAECKMVLGGDIKISADTQALAPNRKKWENGNIRRTISASSVL
jgi:hypothetical protein